MFKKTALIIIFIQISILMPAIQASYPEAEKRVFMISAYYSPLPNQNFYIRGSYEADKKLNGNGTNGADGTPVYIGMLAAPKTYPFGTKIRIPGLGVGVVHDRGGAILAGENYDRIDVWMGAGEEGLARALNWGMRLIEGEIYSDTTTDIQANLNFEWVNSKLPQSTQKRLEANTLLQSNIFDKPVINKTPDINIKDLQEALRIFGYYQGEIDGAYDDKTKDALIAFQIAGGIIANKDSIGAGEIGPKTSAAIQSKIEQFNSKIIKNQNRIEENIKSLTVGLGKKDSGDKVYRLQQMLWELDYYRGELNGVYNSITVDAVYQFQKDHDIVKTSADPGAGYFGSKTHVALAAAAGKRMEKLAEYPKEMQAWVPAKTALPKIDSLNSHADITERNHLLFDINISESNKITANNIFTEDIDLGESGKDVTAMQNILIKKGYLSKGLNTGYFGNQTKSALIKFQINQEIIKKSTDAGAGRVGSGTREVLNNL